MTFKLLITSKWWGSLGEGVAEEQTEDEASRSVRRWWLPGIHCIMMMLHNKYLSYILFLLCYPPQTRTESIFCSGGSSCKLFLSLASVPLVLRDSK